MSKDRPFEKCPPKPHPHPCCGCCVWIAWGEKGIRREGEWMKAPSQEVSQAVVTKTGNRQQQQQQQKPEKAK
eukprot:3265869-Amphidinium_carterae.1